MDPVTPTVLAAIVLAVLLLAADLYLARRATGRRPKKRPRPKAGEGE
jgi:hypothetical protein